jgi:signal transduction histidine kinase
MGVLMEHLSTCASQDPELQGYCQNIADATDDLRLRQKAILAYSRLGRQSLNWEKLEVADLINNVLQVHQEELAQFHTEVELVSCKGSIFSDEYMFYELFSGLLENAIKFSQESQPPKVVISFRRTPNHFLFQIEDNGIGFPTEREHNLFQLFQHIHAASETNFRGLGCGLAFCRRICDRLGGSIWGKGKAGKGASFFVQLPIQIHQPFEAFPEQLRFKRY